MRMQTKSDKDGNHITLWYNSNNSNIYVKSGEGNIVKSYVDWEVIDKLSRVELPLNKNINGEDILVYEELIVYMQNKVSCLQFRSNSEFWKQSILTLKRDSTVSNFNELWIVIFNNPENDEIKDKITEYPKLVTYDIIGEGIDARIPLCTVNRKLIKNKKNIEITGYLHLFKKHAYQVSSSVNGNTDLGASKLIYNVNSIIEYMFNNMENKVYLIRDFILDLIVQAVTKHARYDAILIEEEGAIIEYLDGVMAELRAKLIKPPTIISLSKNTSSTLYITSHNRKFVRGLMVRMVIDDIINYGIDIKQLIPKNNTRYMDSYTIVFKYNEPIYKIKSIVNMTKTKMSTELDILISDYTHNTCTLNAFS